MPCVIGRMDGCINSHFMCIPISLTEASEEEGAGGEVGWDGGEWIDCNVVKFFFCVLITRGSSESLVFNIRGFYQLSLEFPSVNEQRDQ